MDGHIPQLTSKIQDKHDKQSTTEISDKYDPLSTTKILDEPKSPDKIHHKKALQSPSFCEAEKKANVPFLYHHVLECDSNGQQHTIEDHDITLRIPAGAVVEGKQIHFEIGVAMYGPFTFPEKTRPISPVVWLCILEDDAELTKPFQLILPHILTGLKKDRLQHHQIEFLKANHKDISLRDGRMMYNFCRCETKTYLASQGCRSYGVIKSTHCCFYCLQGNQTLEQAIDAGYCLARIERSLSPQRNELHFIAVYLLDTCIQVK